MPTHHYRRSLPSRDPRNWFSLFIVCIFIYFIHSHYIFPLHPTWRNVFRDTTNISENSFCSCCFLLNKKIYFKEPPSYRSIGDGKKVMSYFSSYQCNDIILYSTCIHNIGTLVILQCLRVQNVSHICVINFN